MKKIGLLILCCCIIFILSLLSGNIIFVFLSISAIFVLTVLLIGQNEYYKFLSVRNIDINKDLRRNFDKLILGEESRHKDSLDYNKVLLMTNYNRNFYTDILIMERYYSFIKKDGVIQFNIDFNNRQYFKENKINPLDYTFLHYVTLLEHNINRDSVIYKINNYFNYIRFFTFKRIETRIIFNKSKTGMNYHSIAHNIQYINNFCKTRNLTVEYNIKNIDDEFMKLLPSVEGNSIIYNIVSFI